MMPRKAMAMPHNRSGPKLSVQVTGLAMRNTNTGVVAGSTTVVDESTCTAPR
jgi:hypothetical protein